MISKGLIRENLFQWNSKHGRYYVVCYKVKISEVQTTRYLKLKLDMIGFVMISK